MTCAAVNSAEEVASAAVRMRARQPGPYPALIDAAAVKPRRQRRQRVAGASAANLTTTILCQTCLAYKLVWPTVCGIIAIMVTTDPAEPIKAAVAAHRRAAKRAEQTLAALHAAIAEAASQGVRQTELVKITGYTRERIRQICRAGWISPHGGGS